jgi:hypothetical protein
MKWLVLTLFFICSGINTPTAKAQQADDSAYLVNIHTFLVDFQAKAKAKDSAGLRKLISPFVVDANNSADAIIKHVLKDNINKYGDFSYSNKAFRLIVDTLYVHFAPITRDLRAMLDGKVFKESLTNYTNEQIAVFDHKGVHIILLLKDNTPLLYFWENMNILSPKPSAPIEHNTETHE